MERIRKTARTRTDLSGRYVLANQRENDCTITDLSPGGMTLVCPEKGEIGETVFVSLDNLGRIECQIVRFVHGGMVLKLTARARAAKALSTRFEALQS